MYPRDQLFVTNAKSNDGIILNDLIQVKLKEFILILYSFTPSDMNFHTILMLEVILAKFSSQKKLVPWNKYALITRKLPYRLDIYELLK